MAWNHRSAVVAMAVAIQGVAGTFTAPAAPGDVIAVSVPNNNYQSITTDDPTATGTVWKAKPVYLGRSGTAGATVPLRGPGGAAPPALNAWPVGRVLQSGGFTEIRNAAAIAHVTVAGSTTTGIKLAATESGVDDFYIGAPIQMAALGTAFRATTLISGYNGAAQLATIPETIVAPGAGVAYTIPAYLSYVLGTLSTAPPLLSISIWRDKKRYDYKDWRPTSITFDMPVTNDQNQVFPALEFTGKGVPAGVADDVAPAVPQSILDVPVAPCRGGKWVLDRTKLGHQSTRFALNIDVNAPSNQNQDQGQDSYEITGGTRTVSLDLNQMAIADLDIDSRCDNQTALPILSTWGQGAGNRHGFVLPSVTLDAFSPGDRNGFVNLTGDAMPTGVDKSAAYTVWWA